MKIILLAAFLALALADDVFVVLAAFLALTATAALADDVFVVADAQKQLNSFGYHIAEDGALGPATRAALRDFQSKRHIPVTGELDGTTWYELYRRHPGPAATDDDRKAPPEDAR